MHSAPITAKFPGIHRINQPSEFGLTHTEAPHHASIDDQLRPGISILVPVYNSEATLEPLVRELAKVLPTLHEKFEVLLLNDGSRDKSWQVINRLAEEYVWLRGVCMLRNFGQHNVLLCGVRLAQYDICITMDDDLQHLPSELPKLLAKMAEGYDVVYGTPADMPHSWWRNFTSRTIKHAFALATGNHAIKTINAFRAFHTHLRKAFTEFRSPNLQLDVLLSWGTNKFTNTPVRQDQRAVGQSNYTLSRLFNHTMLLLTGFSTAPLRLASITGLIFTGFGGIILTYAVIRHFVGEAVQGFPFIASIISIFSGIQLFILGIIGEYLARMFNRSLDRPTYVVSETVGSEQQQAGHGEHSEESRRLAA